MSYLYIFQLLQPHNVNTETKMANEPKQE